MLLRGFLFFRNFSPLMRPLWLALGARNIGVMLSGYRGTLRSPTNIITIKWRFELELDESISRTLTALITGDAQKYGYDLHPFSIASSAGWEKSGGDHSLSIEVTLQLSPVFMDAAWELCRRGYVRPGVRTQHAQATSDGGYSITTAGRRMLEEIDDDAVLLLQPGALAETLDQYGERFGLGFRQRAQEAVRCRDSEAWLACCAMVGAAAESILIATAVAKTNNEEAVLSEYGRAGGRRKLIDIIAGQASKLTREKLNLFAQIISYWRDDAAHGQSSNLADANAHEALRQLLHMCQWVDGEWTSLVKP